MHELSGRQSGRVDLVHDQGSFLDETSEGHPQRVAAPQHHLAVFFEQIIEDPLASFRRRRRKLHRHARLSRSRRSEQQARRSPVQAAPQQVIERLVSRFQGRGIELLPVLGGDQPREDLHAAVREDGIMITSDEIDAAKFHDLDAAPARTVIRRDLIDRDHTMGDALHVLVAVGAVVIVQHHHGNLPAGEVLFQRQHLPAITQRRIRQQPELGKRIECDAARLNFVDLRDQRFRRVVQLDFRGVKDRVLRLVLELLLQGGQLEDCDPIQLPRATASTSSFVSESVI